MFVKGMDFPKVFFDPEGGEGGNQNKPDEKIDYLKAEMKTIIEQRDAAKKEKADALAKLQAIEDAKKIEAGEFQKLADDYKKKLDEVDPELKRLKEIETKHLTYLENRKKTVLETIPEEKRIDWQNADLETLEKVAPLFNNQTPLGMDSGKSGKSTIKTDGKSYNDFTIAELDEIKKNNPNEYNRLFSTKKQRIAI